MADHSAIEWTEATWNPIVGCSIHSPGCKGCYAMRVAWRLMHNPNERIAAKFAGTAAMTKAGPVFTGKVNLDEETLLAPLRRKKPTVYFVNSLSDLFHVNVPDEWIDRIFAVMALCPQHTFQVLTKRADRMREYLRHECCALPADMRDAAYWRVSVAAGEIDRDRYNDSDIGGCNWWPIPNVWLGVSVEDQKRANERIPDLLATPAAVRFLSCEPLLDPVDLTWIEFPNERGGMECWDALDLHPIEGETLPEGNVDSTIDWVICGGESGPKARPMHPDWARALRDQCAAAGVPFFFKQWGEWGPDTGPDGDHDRDGLPRDRVMEGAKAAARVDGQWRMFADGYEAPIGLCSGHGEFVYRLGKKRNGRLLDEVTHDGMPAR